MNSLPGTISKIQSTDHMSNVEIDVDGTPINTVILETPASLSYLKVGRNVKVLFKETEVIISREKIEKSSLQNSVEGQITKLEKGELLTRVEMEMKGEKVCSVISTDAANQMNLWMGDSIVASINTNEIMMSE